MSKIPAYYDLGGCQDFYDLGTKNYIPAAGVEAISKIARAWVRRPRFDGENVPLSDLKAARDAIDRQIQIEEAKGL